MRRREFMTLVSGATAWPVVARAQQAGRTRIAGDQKSAHRIAVLFPTRDGDLEYQHRLDALMNALRQLGWTESRNVQVNVRWTGGNSDGIQAIASELVALSPDVILSSGSVATA